MFRRLLLGGAAVLMTATLAAAQVSPGLVERIQNLPSETHGKITDMIAAEYETATSREGTASAREAIRRIERMVAVAERHKTGLGENNKVTAALAEAEATTQVNYLITEIPNGASEAVDAATTQVVNAAVDVAAADSTAARQAAEVNLQQAQDAFDRAYDRWLRDETPTEQRIQDVKDAKEVLDGARGDRRRAVERQVDDLGKDADWEDMPEEYKRRWRALEREQQERYADHVAECDARYKRWTESYIANPVAPEKDLGEYVIKPCRMKGEEIEVEFRKRFEILDGQYWPKNTPVGLPLCKEEQTPEEKKAAAARRALEAEARAAGRPLPPELPGKKKCQPAKAR